MTPPRPATATTLAVSPLRSAINIWAGTANNDQCSLGYAATASDGSWWAITAGHCVAENGGINTRWGHGEQYFGPARDSINNFGPYYIDVDVARIRIDNAYWREIMPGGYLMNINSSNVVQDTPRVLDDRIIIRSQIDVGDPVCLQARFVRYGDSCGTVTREFNGTGQVEVGTYDACPGMSGGAWITPANGEYWGFGVHDGGRDGCPQFDGGLNSSQGYSYFSSLPDINDYWDYTSNATIRVDTR